MNIETTSSNNRSSSAGEGHPDYGYLVPRLSAEEDAIKLHRSRIMDTLELSTLSADNKQRLRRLSADYAMAIAPLPTDDEGECEMALLKRMILNNLSADIPELSDTGMMGLRRTIGKEESIEILIDGQTLSEAELMVAYAAIEPSKEVLDLAVESAAYLAMASDESVESRVEQEPSEHEEPQPDTGEEWGDYDIFEPEPLFDDKHTLMDELRPITGKLAKLGGKVVSIVGLRSPDEHRRAA
jgi:hypothetical protein